MQVMERQLHPATRSAIGSARLEGGVIDDDTAALADQVARGELTDDEAVEVFLARRGITVPTA